MTSTSCGKTRRKFLHASLLGSVVATVLGFPWTLQPALAEAPGTWTATGSMGVARLDHGAALLPTCKAIIAGGATTVDGTNDALASSELYDPVSGTWASTDSMDTARAGSTLILLPNGMVLAAGGRTGSSGEAFSSAELYDPQTGLWEPTGSMAAERDTPSGVLLANGKVLMAGGCGNPCPSAGSELYDPTTGTWTGTGSLITDRADHTLTLLPNGKVLAAGGFTGSPDGPASPSAELYDPAMETWSGTGSLTTGRKLAKAVLLTVGPNAGKVLVVGGRDSSNLPLASAELYDPQSGTWSSAGMLSAVRFVHSATTLPNGKVLVAGGVTGTTPLASAELYDPISGTWTGTGALGVARGGHSATLLPDGRLLVAGGAGGPSLDALTTAELYSSEMTSSPGTEYTFTLIAESTPAFIIKDTAPSMNADGTVAFVAELSPPLGPPASAWGTFTGKGCPLREIARSSPGGGIDKFPTINDTGTVAFRSANIQSDPTLIGRQGIFTGNGRQLTQISGTDFTPGLFGFNPAINNNGLVAFEQLNVIYRGSDGSPASALYNGSRPDIANNDQGTVAFLQGIVGGLTGIVAGNGGTPTTIAFTTFVSQDSPFDFGTPEVLSPPSINNVGAVAFVGKYHARRSSLCPNPTVYEGIFIGAVGVAEICEEPTPIVTTKASPFTTFGSQGTVAINDSGMVAFWAAVRDVGQGIFTGPDPVANKVIQTGDSLFGSTAGSFLFRRWGLNNNGQVAFLVTLADNRTMLVRADPVNHPPTIASFIATPSSGFAPLMVSFTVDASDPDPGGTITEVRWDFDGDGSVDQTTSGLTTSHTYLAAGTFAAGVTVVDNRGATADATTTVTVEQDNMPPTDTGALSATGVNNVVGGVAFDIGGSFTIAWGASLDGQSGVKEYELQRRIGGSEPFVTIATIPHPGTTFEETGLTPSDYFYRVRARDHAGNESAFTGPLQVTVIVDTTPPSGSVVINSGADWVNTPVVTLALTCNDSGGSGCTQMQVAVDGAADTEPFEAIVTSKTVTLPVGDGLKTAAVRFKDGGGNVSAQFPDTIVLDTVAPDVLIRGIFSLSSPAIVHVNTLDFPIPDFPQTGRTGNEGRVASVTVNGVSATKTSDCCGAWVALVPVPLPVPLGGALTFHFVATDLAGNSTSVTRIVDNDGIGDPIDRNIMTLADESQVFSNGFSDVPLGPTRGGTTTGVISQRGGWTVSVADILPGVVVSTTGSGTVAEVATCHLNGPETVVLDRDEETAEVTCVSNGAAGLSGTAVLAVVAKPTILVKGEGGFVCRGSRTTPCFHVTQVHLRTGQGVSLGSPVTANPSNTEPILVELTDENGLAFGSFQLDPSESVDVNVTDLGTVETTVLSGTVTITVAGQTATLSSGQAQTFGSVAIDIKPGGFPNSVNLGSEGTIPVALLSHATLDAPTQIDRTSLTFGRTGDEQSLAFCDTKVKDVNKDKRPDLVCHFKTPSTGFQIGDTQGILKAQTTAGIPLTGLDSVQIVPK